MAISARTRKLLWARSGSLCAVCKCPVIEPETPHDEASVTGEEAHIHGQEAGTARFDPGLSADQLDVYDNLIILCGSHHKMIDDQRVTYTVQRVRDIKAQHEGWVRTRLNSSGEEALDVYRHALAQRIPNAFVGGGKNLSQTTLDALFVEPMLMEPAARRSRVPKTDDAVYTEGYEFENPRPWQVLIPDVNHPCVLMLGEQGSGKSTAIWMLARRLCRLKREVPIWISLPNFALKSDLDFLSYAEHEYPELTDVLLRKLDTQRRLVWLLDGLDEVLESSLRDKVLQAIEALQNVQPARLILVTSRHQPEPQLSRRFIRCEIAPWNDESVEMFVDKYFEMTQSGTDLRHRSLRFLTGLRSNSALYELCQTPLFLSLVLSLGANGEFPWPRPRLYHDALLNILGEWDARKLIVAQPTSRIFSPDDKLVFLRRIAYQMLERRQLSISSEELNEMSLVFCKELFPDEDGGTASFACSLVGDLRSRSAILHPDASGNLAFSHRAWFDCSAALELSGRFLQYDDFATLYSSHWDDPLWSEPLMLTIGYTAQRNASIALPLLKTVLRSDASLDGFLVVESFYFVIRALSYCHVREPLITFAKKLTRAILALDDDVSTGVSSALREAGPRWPGASDLRNAHVNVALSVSDTKNRLEIVLFWLACEDWASEVKEIIRQARRLGPWSDPDVQALLGINPPGRQNMGHLWPSFLRIHIAAAIFLLDRHPIAREFLVAETRSAEAEVRAYAALVLISFGDNVEVLLWLLHAALGDGIWRGYVLGPLRHFIHERIEACRSLTEDDRDILIEVLREAQSELIRDLVERVLAVPRATSESGTRWRPDAYIREILELDHVQTITAELIKTRQPDLRIEQIISILETVARHRILPRTVWRGLAEDVLPGCTTSFERYEVACLLGARSVLEELTNDQMHDVPTPDAARRALKLGKALDAVLSVGG